MRLFAPDFVLLHPPAVYDFRRRRSLFGPISDVVPSTPVFEMYPLGWTSLAGRLEGEGFNVRIVNVAYRMLEDVTYDPEAHLRGFRPRLFGIDLHWLLHANGALELARRVKRIHPEIPVILGGLSASYYHRELIRYACVDLVMRGDSTEAPMIALLRALHGDGSFRDVPNLTWKDAAGGVHVNAMGEPPPDLDETPLPDYRYALRSAARRLSLTDIAPYVGWREEPIAGVLTSRGCPFECSFCGGGRSAYRCIANRRRPAFRSADRLADDLFFAQKLTRAPVILLNDIRLGGRRRVERFLDRLQKGRFRNELVFELFFPAGAQFFERAARAAPRFSLQISVETHREELRRRIGKFPHSNDEIEATLAAAIAHGVNRVDLFFMIGLPGQTYEDALDAVEYCRSLWEKFGCERIGFFLAPLTPFLDPGSPAFESPERHGVRVRWRRFAPYRRAMTAPTWKQMLNYETEAMSRDEIVRATYDGYDRLAALKRDFGVLSEEAYRETLRRTRSARATIEAVDRASSLPDRTERTFALREVRRSIAALQDQPAQSKRELRWPRRGGIRRIRALPMALGALAEELVRLATRRIPLVWALRRRGSRGRVRSRDRRDVESTALGGAVGRTRGASPSLHVLEP